MIAWSWTAWVVSVLAVLLSGVTAWRAGLWRRGADLDLGFGEHGGMWGDLLLLPVANAVIVPHVHVGRWLTIPVVVASVFSMWVHIRWYQGGGGPHWREHLWPARRHAAWSRDLSGAGWLHVFYVIGEVAVLLAYAVSPVPWPVVLVVSVLLTLHVCVGLLHPVRMLTGRWSVRNPLLVPALVLVWAVAFVKLV